MLGLPLEYHTVIISGQIADLYTGQFLSLEGIALDTAALVALDMSEIALDGLTLSAALTALASEDQGLRGTAGNSASLSGNII
jgi:hypothetical protein